MLEKLEGRASSRFHVARLSRRAPPTYPPTSGGSANLDNKIANERRAELVAELARLPLPSVRMALYAGVIEICTPVDQGRRDIEEQSSLFVPVSKKGAAIQKHVRKPEAARKPVGYDRAFLDAYRPNATAYLSAKERERLHKIGTPQLGEQPAGTYAKQILSRLLMASHRPVVEFEPA